MSGRAAGLFVSPNGPRATGAPAALAPRTRHTLRLRGTPTTLGERTWVMGVLNVTPDSFSDASLAGSNDDAARRGLALFEAGADIVDVGGESTRPGSRRVDEREELRRVVPVITALRRQASGWISIDTTRAAVARAALEAGADVVNDVSGLRFDPAMATLVAASGVPAVVMHLRGDFENMHASQRYSDVAADVASELDDALARAVAAGVRAEQLIVDPGIGFSKDPAQSLELLRRLPELAALGRPILVGPSRKRFIGAVLDLPVTERLMGTAAAAAAAIIAGAHIVRVHDVPELVQVARVCDAILAS